MCASLHTLELIRTSYASHLSDALICITLVHIVSSTPRLPSDLIMSSEPEPVEPDCPRCNSLITTEYTPTGRPGRVGDICVIRESPNVPVHEILTGLPPTYATDIASDTTETVGSDVQATPPYWRGFKKRPCVVTRRRHASSPIEVCLMATFGHTAALKDIPEILQRFCVPVYPHVIPHMQHLHTHPEWVREDGWVLARRMHSTAPVSRRWKNVRSETPDESFFKADDEALVLLLEQCERKQEEWEALIQQDPEAPSRCLKEYDDTLRAIKRAVRAEAREKRQRKRQIDASAVSATTPPTPGMVSDPAERPRTGTSESSAEDVPMVTTPVVSSFSAISSLKAISKELGRDVEEEVDVDMAKIVTLVEDPPSELGASAGVGDTNEKMEEEVAAT
ncbi:hypothetical protein C8Q73DRAFT_707109 [Cubamyces lactineus]|nr:hypothetical protein C8Q73DRAFT_707109 [Cubamyces lactineus]